MQAAVTAGIETMQDLNYAAAYCSLAICSLPRFMPLLCMGCCAQQVGLLWHVAKEYNRSAIVLKQSQQQHPQATAWISHCMSKPSGGEMCLQVPMKGVQGKARSLVEVITEAYR